ncbi:hypothetical protein GCM10023145_28640 [Angustibacter luteus]
MTETLERTEADGAASSPARARVDAWLGRLEQAIAARDAETAASLFAVESFWRDLVAFTWNIRTAEGRDGVADLLRGTMDVADARGFRSDPDEESRTTRTASPRPGSCSRRRSGAGAGTCGSRETRAGRC